MKRTDGINWQKTGKRSSLAFADVLLPRPSRLPLLNLMTNMLTRIPPVIAIVLVASAAGASEPYPEPYAADVIDVIDGDSLKVHAHIWPGMIWSGTVRVNGVDTPEINGDCEEEELAAAKAKAFVEALMGERRVFLVGVEPDKYAGRVDATVVLLDGRSMAQVIIDEGLGRAYDGGAREGWCE